MYVTLYALSLVILMQNIHCASQPPGALNRGDFWCFTRFPLGFYWTFSSFETPGTPLGLVVGTCFTGERRSGARKMPNVALVKPETYIEVRNALLLHT
jgi:hypothetical protein